MNSINNLKHYACKKHPNRVIEKVCLVSGCKDPLCCSECISSSHCSSHSEYLSYLDQFAVKIGSHYETIKAYDSSNDFDNLFQLHIHNDLFLKEEEIMSKLNLQIDSEKKFVKEAIDFLLKNFGQMCLKAKENIFNSLDNQVVTMQANFNYLKNKINHVFEEIKEDQSDKKMVIVDLLNNTKTIEEFEALIKNLKNYIEEMKHFEERPDNLGTSYENIKKMFNDLAEQLLLLPKTQANLNQNPNIRIIENFQSIFDDFIKSSFDIDEAILPLSLGVKNPLLDYNMIIEDDKLIEGGYESDEEEMASSLS